MEKITLEQKRIINKLFNHLFSTNDKMQFLKLIFPFTTTEVNLCRGNASKVSEIFDRFFTIEDKIEGIKVHYEMKELNYGTLEEMIEHRELLKDSEENQICIGWKRQRERIRQKPCYI